MTTLVVYQQGEGASKIRVKNVDEAQLMSYLNQLDGKQTPNLSLSNEAGHLFIYCSIPSKDLPTRMNVMFSDGGFQMGYLLDDTQPEEPELEFLIDNGQVDVWQMNETVTPEIAHQVALHFLKQGALPDGFHWSGQINQPEIHKL